MGEKIKIEHGDSPRMKVFITRRIPEDGIRILEREGLEVTIFPEERIPTKEEIINGVKDADALISLLTDKIDREVMDAAPNLKVIGNYAVGYNNIDVEYARKKGIVVVNTPGVLTDATADLAFALILAVSRRIVEGDKLVRRGEFKGWAPLLLLGKDVWGATIGIIGAGRIGQAVGRRARGFNMRILYYDRERKEEFEREVDAKFVTLEELLQESDIITLHVPLTQHTYHLLGEREFEMMKDGVVIVNTSRGEVIDEEALIKAIKKGKVFSVGLDVFENEPNIREELLQLPNVVLTPHIGSATERTRRKMAEMVCSDVLRVLKGEEPLNRVV